MKQEEKRERELLIHLLKDEKNYNKYLFVNNYVPAIMIRKGFDYVDSYLTASASDNFFLFDKQAVNYKKGWASTKYKETLLRCLYINERGQIAQVIKRKMKVSSVNTDSVEIDKEYIPEGISRLYKNQMLTNTEEFISNIIGVREFEYFYIEKSQKSIDIYRVEIINNYSRDMVISNINDCEVDDFITAELIYNEDGEFLDLKVTDDVVNSNNTNSDQTNDASPSLENEDDLPQI